MTNDYGISEGDKWRTAAAEIDYNDFTFGFNVYTTVHGKEFIDWESKIWGKHKYGLGAYKKGRRLQSPAYVGYKNMGMLYRVGIDSPWVQDATQNWKHHGMKKHHISKLTIKLHQNHISTMVIIILIHFIKH